MVDHEGSRRPSNSSRRTKAQSHDSVNGSALASTAASSSKSHEKRSQSKNSKSKTKTSKSKTKTSRNSTMTPSSTAPTSSNARDGSHLTPSTANTSDEKKLSKTANSGSYRLSRESSGSAKRARRDIVELLVNSNLVKGDENYEYVPEHGEIVEDIPEIDPETSFSNDDEVALSPDDDALSPQISSSRIIQIAAEMSFNDKKQGDTWHVFMAMSVMFSIERYLSFPMIVVENGGYAYLGMFAVVTVLITWPMVCLEIFLGQYTSLLPDVAFEYILPLMKGMKYVFPIIRISRICTMRADPLVMYYLHDYFFALFFGERDHTCFEQGKYCVPKKDEYCDCLVNGICYLAETIKLPREHTMVVKGRAIATLSATPNHQNMHQHHMPDPVFTYMVTLLAIATYMFQKMSIGKFSKFAAIFFVIAVASLIVACSVINSNLEPNYEIPTMYDALFDPAQWGNALQLSMELYSVGDGSLHSLGTLMPFHYNAYRVIFVVLPVSVGLMITCWFLVIPVLNEDTGNIILNMVSPSRRHAFLQSFIPVQTYNESLSSYLTLFICAGMFLTQFPYLVVAISAVRQRMSLSKQAMVTKNEILISHCYMAASCFGAALLILFSLYMMEWVGLWMSLIRFSFPVMLFLETFIIAHVYGAHRFIVNIQTMTGRTFAFVVTHQLLHFCWAYVIPPFTMILFPVRLAVSYYGLLFIPIALILFMSVFMAVGMVVAQIAFGRPVQDLVRSRNKFGPLNVDNRRKARYDERAARIL